jgi:hypothetical protein
MKTRVFFFAVLILALTGSALVAQTIAYVVPAGTVGNQNLSGASQSLGMDFNVNSPIDVISLGVFDSGGNGLVAPLRAHIFDRDTQLSLADLLFTPQSPGTLIGGSRFKPLPSPLTLSIGFHGTIVVDYTTSPTEPNGNLGDGPGSWTTDSGAGLISFVGSGRHTVGGTGAGYPNIIDGGPANRFASGTFQFQPVPEPSAFFLLAMGGICLLLGRKFVV